MTSDNGQVVTAENGAALIIQNARQLSVTGRSAGPLIACSAVRINCADDVSIQNSGSGMAVSTGGFEVQNAKNVFVSGASENAVVSSGGTNSITCSEKLIIQMRMAQLRAVPNLPLARQQLKSPETVIST